MDLNKHIVKSDNDSPLHSSGYAQIASGDRIGSTSSMSFEQRLQIERNRQVVGGYNRSAIGRSYGVLRAKAVSNEVGRRGVLPPPQPTVRKYDPYA